MFSHHNSLEIITRPRVVIKMAANKVMKKVIDLLKVDAPQPVTPTHGCLFLY